MPASSLSHPPHANQPPENYSEVGLQQPLASPMSRARPPTHGLHSARILTSPVRPRPGARTSQMAFLPCRPLWPLAQDKGPFATRPSDLPMGQPQTEQLPGPTLTVTTMGLDSSTHRAASRTAGEGSGSPPLRARSTRGTGFCPRRDSVPTPCAAPCPTPGSTAAPASTRFAGVLGKGHSEPKIQRSGHSGGTRRIEKAGREGASRGRPWTRVAPSLLQQDPGGFSISPGQAP